MHWRAKRGSRSAGAIAGNLHKASGYIQIRCEGFNYKAHRLAWLMKTGEWPRQTIDHINGVRADNRWLNLRDVSRIINSQNLADTRGVYKHEKGATWYFKLVVREAGFATFEEAREAYLAAKAKMHPGWARQ